MADDYGALVLIEALPACGDRATLAITLLEAGFAEGRRFDLRPSGVPGGVLSGGAGRPVAVRDGMAG